MFQYPKEWGAVEEKKLQIHDSSYANKIKGDLVKYHFSNKKDIYFGAKTDDYKYIGIGIYLINQWERDITGVTCNFEVSFKPLIMMGCKQIFRGGMGINEGDIKDEKGYLIPMYYEEFYTGMDVMEYRFKDPVLSKHYIIDNSIKNIYNSIVFTYDFKIPEINRDNYMTKYSSLENSLIDTMIKPTDDIKIFDIVVNSIRLIQNVD